MTAIEAFELALDLAISAPTDEQTQRAVILAEEIAMQLTPKQVNAVKAKFEVTE